MITVHGEQMFVEDLASKNGTFVDGTRVRGRVPLQDGAEIRLGLLKLHVRAVSSETPTVTEG